jgi:hypothetical protein
VQPDRSSNLPDYTAPDPPDLGIGTVQTEPNVFGIWRKYPHCPSIDPDGVISVAPAQAVSLPPSSGTGALTSLSHALQQFDPIANLVPHLPSTVLRLLDWFHSTNTKSNADLDALVHKVILADDFDREDLHNFSAHRALHMLDTPSGNSSHESASNGWINATVHLPVPIKGLEHSEVDAPRFPVSGLRYWRPLEVIRDVFSNAPIGTMHLTPFHEYQRSEHGVDQRIYSEVYTSDRFINEHNRIRNQFQTQTNLETVVAAMMLWSDSTHLANFGTASLWPVYLFFGNVSKYTRARPTSFSSHHLAYLPSVS